MKLSDHFTSAEFRCKCCKMLPEGGISAHLLAGLEELRAISDKPITIVSGYRCPLRNASLPGTAKHSQHMLGRAADIRINGMTISDIREMAETVEQFATGGIGVYPTFLHVDVRGCHGQKRARWKGKKDG